jgi:hypothetical protein
VAAFPYEVDNDPVFLAPLQVREIQISQFAPSQTTAKQNRQDRPIPFAFKSVLGWRLPQPTSLVSGEPISKPHTQLPYAFDASNACSKLRAEEPGVGGFVRQPSHNSEPSIDCARSELTIFEKDAVTGHHNLAEGQPWLGTVPLNEFINRVSVPSLRFW